MSTTENYLIRQAIEISALIGDHSESLIDLVASFLKSEYNLTFSKEQIGKMLDRESASRLFFAVGKQNPSEIRSPQNCLRIARDLWLDYFIANNSDTISAESCVEAANARIKKESALNLTSEKDYRHLQSAVNLLSDSKMNICEYKAYITKTIPYYEVAFYILNNFFESTSLKAVSDIYNPFNSVNDDKPIEEIHSPSKVDSRIKYLEKAVRELKIKLEYAQKDAVRNIVMTLTSSGYGSPLFELNNLRKDDATPESVTAAISNLFLALESMDVRISKDNCTGKHLSYNEITEGKYCVIYDEPLSEEDSIIIKYPGVKLGKEMIVKPTIAKEV